MTATLREHAPDLVPPSLWDYLRDAAPVLAHGDAAALVTTWPSPTLIISDGAYGLGKFAGEPSTVEGLPEWYAPHLDAWTRRAGPRTTLWLWNTEVGWATVHPELVRRGWVYTQLVTWDKGIAHVAGRVNSLTIRSLPVVTEVCARYVRPLTFLGHPLQAWLRSEWQRSGLTLDDANRACGVIAAAGRKYLGSDQQWYPPPGEMLMRLVVFAQTHGDPAGAPYFAGESPEQIARVACLERAVWNHEHGLTNVWAWPAGTSEMAKPEELMARIIRLSSYPGDVVWEPFGGRCPVARAGWRLGRTVYSAEIDGVMLAEARASLTAVIAGRM